MNREETKSVIVVINTLSAGGAEKNCVVICNEFVNQGIVVDLWVTRLSETPNIKLLDSRVRITPIPGKRVRNALTNLKKLLIQNKSKIILVFSIELIVPITIINKLYRCNLKIIGRSINTLSLVYAEQGFIHKKFTTKIMQYSLNRISCVIAQSTGMKADLIHNFKLNNNKIQVIHNPSYNFASNTKESDESTDARNEILFVGRLTKQKGLNYLLDALKLVAEHIPEIHLRIVGSGELEHEIKAKVIELELNNSVTFEGYQTNLTKYYKRASATVLTSLYEGFPNVLVESISVGTPVISFDCKSGPSDILLPGVNGILVEHLNVESFAKAIADVISGNIKFDKQAVINSSQRFKLDTIINQYKHILFDN